MMKSSLENTNYSEDESEYFNGLLEYLKQNVSLTVNENHQNIEIEINNLKSLDIYNINTVYYVAGYLTQSIISNQKNC